MIPFGECALDTDNRRLYRGGQPHELSPTTFQVLRYFLERPDRLVSKAELSKTLWPDQDGNDAALESIVKRVRQEIGDSGHRQRYIRTIRGAGYRFVAPVEPAPVPVRFPTTPSTRPERRSLRDATILVVDDAPDAIGWLSATLSGDGFHSVLTTHDAVEALDLAATNNPAVILLDLQLYPREHPAGCAPYVDRGRYPDGIDVVQGIRQMNIEAPIILMSGVEKDTDTAVEAIVRGANDFLKKPFRSEEVLEKVRKHLIAADAPWRRAPLASAGGDSGQ
jgi:DNA-binding response OmpR family regulator